MFSLSAVLAWITRFVSPEVARENEYGQKESITGQTDEIQGISKMDEHEDTNLVSTALDPDHHVTSDVMVLNGVAYELLEPSDSEDWDQEISMLQTRDVSDTHLEKSVSYSLINSEENTSSTNVSRSQEALFGDQPNIFTNDNNLELNHLPQQLSSNEIEHGKASILTSCDTAKFHEPLFKDGGVPVQEFSQNESKTPIKSGTNPQSHSVNLPPQRTENHSEQYDAQESLYAWSFMEKLNNLETAFSSPDKEVFLTVLRGTLQSVPSPYSFLLYLVENYYSNVTDRKNSMAHMALTKFDQWHRDGLFSASCPAEMDKDRALWIVTTRKLYLFDLCNKVFKLDSKGNEFLQKHVHYLLDTKKRYKEAVTIAFKLHLQPYFQPMEILLPLVILNKVQLAESYIFECPYQQRAFVSMLNKLCVMTDEELELLASEIVPHKPTNCKITQASFTKLGERIVKKFNLDPEEFPELFEAKNLNGLCYLLHQQKKDRGRSTKKWDDLIERCVGNNESLQNSLVRLLTDYGDLDGAGMWARFYKLQHHIEQNSQEDPTNFDEKEDWDSEMRESEEAFADLHTNDGSEKGRSKDSYFSENTGLSSSQPRQWYERHSTDYLALEIPMEKIYFIDDYKSLRGCQRAISEPGVTLGFDAEWKPQMCQAGLVQRLSIVQVSVRDSVYILDVIALAEKVEEASLLSFGNAVFANENVLKLGYGVESDFKALVATIPVMVKAVKKMKRFVDLCSLSQHLFESPVMKKKVEKITRSLTSFGHLSEKGLSLLVQQCLGLPLDKTYQLSDWEQRPLLEKQVVYAALDARCLIDVFDVLNKWMAEEKIEVDLNEYGPRLPWLFPKRSRKAKGKLGKQPKPGSSNFHLQQLNQPPLEGSPNSPKDFRVVVDNMLQGLGRYLRCCGVDVTMLANDDDHDKAAQIARREDRVILTTGMPYYTLRSQVPLGKCMCVPAGSAKEQVLAVFKHFNISVNTSDIFSRCQVCNGNEYIKVSSVLMRQAYINYYEKECEQSEKRVKTYLPSTKTPRELSSSLDVDTLFLRSGVKLKIEALPESILDKIDMFFCCATCGKIFWEGGHFSRVCAQFSEILNSTESFYEKSNPKIT